MRTRTLLLPTVALAVLALPASASALIQVDRGISGVRVGNTPAQVHASLGRPARVVRGRNDFGGFVEERYAGGIRVLYSGSRNVTLVDTTGFGDRTAANVGIGSSEAQVKAGVRGVRCATDAGLRHCFTGQFRAGQRVTDFFIRGGRVWRVSVGVVID